MDIQKLTESRNKATHDIQALIDRAKEEERGLDADERASYDRLTDLYSQLTDQITRATELAASQRALAEIGAGTQTPPVEDTSEAARFDAFRRGETRSFLSLPEQRDIVKGTASAGGNTVPTSLYNQVTQSILDQSPMVGLAFRMDTASGEKIQIPTATAFGAQVTAEGVAIGENDPTFGLVDLDVSKYTNLAQLSSEVIDDSVLDLQAMVADGSGQAIGNAFGTALSAGVEAGVVAGPTAGAVSYDKLVDLYYSVQGVHQGPGVFAMNGTTAASVRKLVGSDDHPIWGASLVPGQPETLLGRQVVIDDTMANDGSVLFGNFSRAVVVRFAGGLRVERSADYAFANDLVTWRVILRAGFAVRDTAAVKKLTAS